MKKRLFALVLALAMTVALCACGGDKPSDQTVDPTNTGSTGEKLTGGTLTVGIAADWTPVLTPTSHRRRQEHERSSSTSMKG